MAESGRAKKHVFCSEGTVAGTGCKTLACALAKSWYTVSSVRICLAANGLRIREGRGTSLYFIRRYNQCDLLTKK